MSSSDDDVHAEIQEAEPDDERVWTSERRRRVRRYRNAVNVRMLWRLLNPRDDDEYRVTMRSLLRYIAHYWP